MSTTACFARQVAGPRTSRPCRFLPLFLTVCGAAFLPLAHADIVYVDIAEDTYADSSAPTTVKGNETQMILKDANGSNYDRIVYLEANYASVSGTINSVTLYFYSKDTIATTPVTVQGLADDSKSEANITWNNQPSTTNATSIGVVNVSTAGWYTIDVTSYVTGESSDKTVTFKLADTTSQGTWMRIASSEESDTTKRPFLEFNVSSGSSVQAVDIVHDTYADSSDPTTNKGSQAQMVLKNASGSNYDRIVYMGTDFSAVSGTVTAAHLHFYNKSAIATTPVTVYGLTDDSKTEANITWNNQPSSSGAMNTGSVDVSAAGWYNKDVTTYVASQSSDKVVTFKLADDSQQSTFMTIASSEESDTTKRPFLELEVAGSGGDAYIVSSGGHLSFPADANGYKIPDFSYAGYLSSNEDLPVFGTHYDTEVSLSYPSGDETSRIQNAINTVSALTPNAHGYRGAVTLGAGTWNVKTLTIGASGVVLRGAGIGSTIIQYNRNFLGQGESRPGQVIRMGASSVNGTPVDIFTDGKSGTKWNITTNVVHVGDRTFDVASGHTLQAGDQIIIEHPCTSAWLSAIGGGAPTPEEWGVDTVPIRYNRYVTAVNGNTITIDAPVMYSLVKSISQCFVYKYTGTTVHKMGIENLTVDNDIETNSLVNTHAVSDSIRFNRAENCWARNVRTQNFNRSGIYFAESTRNTVDNCEANDPHSVIGASKRYGFNCRGGQLILFRDCSGVRNRHTYITNGHGTDGGNVYLRCEAFDTYAASEHGHQRWSNGSLWDGCTFDHVGSPESGANFNAQMLWLGNHGSNSNGHGWASVTSVAYKCTVSNDGHAIIAKPPTGMNYEIDCTGDFRSAHSAHGDYPGAIDVPTSGTLPTSLFEAQLAQRLP